MRHRVAKIKLNRSGSHRHSLERNLVRSLFLEGGITTTEAKAKWTRSNAEHLISLAKKQAPLPSLRRLLAATGSLAVAKKIREAAGRLGQRNSGYFKLTKVGIRTGDKATLVKIEFLWDEVKTAPKTGRSKRQETK